MRGTIAITDFGWYERLRALPGLEEVNFWKPSAARRFNAPEFSPFLFKLRAPHNTICGYAFFARYSVLPDWFAWETFAEANGTATFRELRARILTIRERIKFHGDLAAPEIGCILLVQPVFFPPGAWVAPPGDWPVRAQSYIGYDLAAGEGRRVWADCLTRTEDMRRPTAPRPGVIDLSPSLTPRYGSPIAVRPRLGQGTFRVAVTDAYGRACAVTQEHSLPALEAVHIRSYAEEGPHAVANGLLLRADFHRLFDQGYLTVSPDHYLEVSRRLREDFANGHSYYPFHGKELSRPSRRSDWPDEGFLAWHREERYLG
jgi:putative restriction endonuclease